MKCNTVQYGARWQLFRDSLGKRRFARNRRIEALNPNGGLAPDVNEGPGFESLLVAVRVRRQTREFRETSRGDG